MTSADVVIDPEMRALLDAGKASVVDVSRLTIAEIRAQFDQNARRLNQNPPPMARDA